MPMNRERVDSANMLIEEKVGGPHAAVERVITVQSVPLPGTRIGEVERIQLTERVIRLPSANKAAA